MDKSTSHVDAGAYLKRMIELDKSALPPDGGKQFNRLIFSCSPYLLQHSENPVDWYPWGEEAFARAKKVDKPVFLSIGYATCHWCHVMAHESFEDLEVAEVLNRHFIAIKVDREERPDIDDLYMTVSQMMTGSGGWPLQIIMMPDRQPFFTATYLPKHSRQGMPGLIEVLEQIAELWRTRRETLLQNCAVVLKSLAALSLASPGEVGGRQVFDHGYAQIRQMYDSVYGGFGSAPKFPMPHYGSFLLRYHKRTSNMEALNMTEHTLLMMRGGGICDQIGYGFHRYAVDRQWLVPHFEKMLYDQALIALSYLETFQTTGNRFHLCCAEEIFLYLLREMAAPGGGFYSAQDADTEGEEGKYYVWTEREVLEVLGEETGRLFCRVFDVTGKGNFEGRNILHLASPLEEIAAREGLHSELLRARMDRAGELLLAAREKRIRPLRDEKILTAWNGLAIAALARGGGITGDEKWLSAAVRAASFIRGTLMDPDGRLMRSYHLGTASGPGFLEDYAFYVWGVVELYEATAHAGFLEEALHVTREMVRLFSSEDNGGLYDSDDSSDNLPVRTRTAYDGVIPSGNSVAAMNFVKLGKITGDPTLVNEGEKILKSFMGAIGRQPAGYLHLLTAYDFYLGPDVEITVIGSDGEAMSILRSIKAQFIPNLVLKFEQGKGEARSAAHVCAAGACHPPVYGPDELTRLLEEVV